MKLNLGCGMKPIDGYINHDINFHHDFIDTCWDCNVYPYPWLSESVSEIRAWDLIEHLNYPERFIEECYRILKVGGLLQMRTPTETSPTKWRDITHRRVFHVDSFDYYDNKTQLGKDFGFYSNAKFDIIDKEVDTIGSLVIKMIKI